MDSVTLFLANAVILLVMAVAFLAAWRGQPSESSFGSWIAANVSLSLALAIFAAHASVNSIPLLALGHCLLVVGMGLRYVAAREFNARPVRLGLALAPVGVVIALFAALEAGAPPAIIFALINLVLSAQTIAIGMEFWRGRGDGLRSRWGLVAAYALIAGSFAVRVVQPVWQNGELAGILPDDIMLEAHLVVALVHTTASGAFALSAAFERTAAAFRRAALRDPLTGLANRRAFLADVKEALAKEDGTPFALVLVDLDHFKRVNDSFGHASGDRALVACASACRAAVRPSDSVARIGGEEFAIFLPDTDEAEACRVAERVREEVSGCVISTIRGSFGLTASVGLSCRRADTGAARDFDSLFQEADGALYRAKSAGRNRLMTVAA